MRAYAAAAGAVLDVARIVKVVPTRRLGVIVPYELNGVADSIAVAHNIPNPDSVFGQVVTQIFTVTLTQLGDVEAESRERTAGRAGIERLG